MPLKPGKKNMGKNYRELTKKHPKMSRKQKVAIILSEAGIGKKKSKKK